MNELKPCPFCGNDYMLTTEKIGWKENLHEAGCGNCLAQGPICDSDKEAIEAWNSRADEERIRRETIEECANAVGRMNDSTIITRVQAMRTIRTLAKDAE